MQEIEAAIGKEEVRLAKEIFEPFITLGESVAAGHSEARLRRWTR